MRLPYRLRTHLLSAMDGRGGMACDASERGGSVPTIVIPQAEWPGKLLNLNAMRGHTANLGRLAAPWRRLGLIVARREDLGTFTRPVNVWARFRFPSNRRRDTGNLYPTVKALIDGMVDARVLADDCDGIVFGPWLEREYPNGPAQITIEIETRAGQ